VTPLERHQSTSQFSITVTSRVWHNARTKFHEHSYKAYLRIKCTQTDDSYKNLLLGWDRLDEGCAEGRA
jgi:hypothetical protein